MRILFLVATLFFPADFLYAQRMVYDRDHLAIVSENGFTRVAAEITTQLQYSAINDRLSDIKINIGALVLTQDLIFGSLTQIDQGFKSAIAVKQIAALITEIFNESDQMIAFAVKQPQLLLFSQEFSQGIRRRSTALLADVSGLVLKEESDLLLDIEKRDALLKKISLELRVIRALVYSMRKSMFWAAQKSLLSQLNPYQNFINIDRRLVNNIIYQYKTLKK